MWCSLKITHLLSKPGSYLRPGLLAFATVIGDFGKYCVLGYRSLNIGIVRACPLLYIESVIESA